MGFQYSLEPTDTWKVEKQNGGFWEKSLYKFEKDGFQARFNASLFLSKKNFILLDEILRLYSLEKKKWSEVNSQEVVEHFKLNEMINEISKTTSSTLTAVFFCSDVKNRNSNSKDQASQVEFKFSCDEKYANDLPRIEWILNVHVHPENSKKANRTMSRTTVNVVTDELGYEFGKRFKDMLCSLKDEVNVLRELDDSNCERYGYKIKFDNRNSGVGTKRKNQFWSESDGSPRQRRKMQDNGNDFVSQPATLRH